jgi:hypothetical protein
MEKKITKKNLSCVNIYPEFSYLNYSKKDKDFGKVEKIEKLDLHFKIIEHQIEYKKIEWTHIHLSDYISKIYPDIIKIDIWYNSHQVLNHQVDMVILYTKELTLCFDQIITNDYFYDNHSDCSIVRKLNFQ